MGPEADLRRGARCPEHDLATATDGSCVLCRRERRQQSASRARLLVWIAVVGSLLALGAVGAHVIVGRLPSPSQQTPAHAPPAEPTVTVSPLAVAPESPPVVQPPIRRPAEEARPRRARRRPRRQAARPAPTARRERRPAEKTGEEDGQRDEEAHGSRRRMNKLYRSLALQQARRQVAITMYMAKW